MIGTKFDTEATDPIYWVVGEHSVSVEASSTRGRGAIGRDYAGMSSDKTGEKPVHRKPKVS
jgi:hypothetical protein